jgi:zinc D-Ala-D-Ala carboxypeptidase
MHQAAAARPASSRALRVIVVGLVVMSSAIVGTLVGRASPSAFALGGILQPTITDEDGILPDGVTVFETSYPGIARLDPDLLGALRRSTTAAADDGVPIFVNSGWRSRAYQDQLLRDAVAEYGSVDEAARWVATADTSPHVAGEAVDVGPAQASAWLSKHGARYGLCQIYRNEPWHFELRPQAIDGRCPRLYADPTHDPRMQR